MEARLSSLVTASTKGTREAVALGLGAAAATLDVKHTHVTSFPFVGRLGALPFWPHVQWHWSNVGTWFRNQRQRSEEHGPRIAGAHGSGQVC